MSLFRRDKKDRPVPEVEIDDPNEDNPEVEVETISQDSSEDLGVVGRPRGPWDADDAPDDDQVRLDLGSLRLPGFEGMEIQVNVAPGGSDVIGVTAVAGDAALQLQPFAAPRREGIWDEVRGVIAAEIARDGGTVIEAEGPFGPELRAKLSAQQPDGTKGLVPARFIGVDGPRWFLRGVLTGKAAVDEQAARRLEEVFRGTVVVRGGDPRAPQEPLPLRLPDSAPAPEPSAPARPPLDLGTGHQIAEIH